MSQHCLPPNVMHKEHSHFCSISVKYAWLISDHEEILETPRLKVILKNENLFKKVSRSEKLKED